MICFLALSKTTSASITCCATPVCYAASTTALATAAGISTANAVGNILNRFNSATGMQSAIAWAAAI